MPDPRWRKCLKCCVVKSLDDFPPNFFICASCDAASPKKSGSPAAPAAPAFPAAPAAPATAITVATASPVATPAPAAVPPAATAEPPVPPIPTMWLTLPSMARGFRPTGWVLPKPTPSASRNVSPANVVVAAATAEDTPESTPGPTHDTSAASIAKDGAGADEATSDSESSCLSIGVCAPTPKFVANAWLARSGVPPRQATPRTGPGGGPGGGGGPSAGFLAAQGQLSADSFIRRWAQPQQTLPDPIPSPRAPGTPLRGPHSRRTSRASRASTPCILDLLHLDLLLPSSRALEMLQHPKRVDETIDQIYSDMNNMFIPRAATEILDDDDRNFLLDTTRSVLSGAESFTW